MMAESATSAGRRCADDADLVLVTGGSGFVGSHTVRRLLADGYRVRATVRDPSREADLRAMVAEPTDRLEIVRADLSADAGWGDAVAGATYVLHVASPFPAMQPDNPEDVIIPARDGALRVLRAARDAGVRRVVLTSSFAAVGYSGRPGSEYDETDWTDPAEENTPYVRSKTIAERAAWDFVAAEGGGLDLSVINPSGIFGPLLGTHMSASTGLVRAMLDGAMPVAPPLSFGVVDVRDVADIHVRAMTHPAAAGQRFLASGGTAISFLRLAQILAEHLGAAAARVPTRELTPDEVREAARSNPALRDSVNQLGRIPVLHTDKARTVLGWTSRDTITTLVDTAHSLLRIRQA
ncbi:Dihydroflavonol-4-reductase [Frankia canadensis]|uniref:Dihydroflavonol-4-reductase n=1 Tax=Frankia canadensis TaxID=1836972 RepID=A0A2I2KRH6_9ACTN|nr:aldehyde reductase [Frankia canadensis]SNQ48273.1 Dihydroflavonol-4-reductase [Frankia canadensis]SOU55563.1 Dihydroflavonol-4-reductase [Frankia canadensis]